MIVHVRFNEHTTNKQKAQTAAIKTVAKQLELPAHCAKPTLMTTMMTSKFRMLGAARRIVSEMTASSAGGFQ
jgi:hypothetical protein